MRRGLLVAAVALALVAPGCLEGGLDRLWTDLEAQPDHEERSLFQEEVDFSAAGTLDPQNPPDDSENVGDRWNTTFDLPTGTRSATVLFTVNFTTNGSQLPMDPGPSNEGQIRLYLEGPGENDTQDRTYESSISGGFDVTGPAPGEWTFGFEAVGDGTVEARGFATVPVES